MSSSQKVEVGSAGDPGVANPLSIEPLLGNKDAAIRHRSNLFAPSSQATAASLIDVLSQLARRELRPNAVNVTCVSSRRTI